MAIELAHPIKNGYDGDLARDEMQRYFMQLKQWSQDLTACSQDVDVQGVVSELSQTFGYRHESDNLYATVHRGIGYISPAVYADCNFTILVNEGPTFEPPSNTVCVGFNIVPEHSAYFSHMPREYVEHRQEIDPGDVIVSQIQAGAYNNLEFAQGWRWEQALVTLVTDFASYARLGRVHIWPGELVSKDFDLTDEEKVRFMTRYNGTAKGLGFKRSKSGIYTQPL